MDQMSSYAVIAASAAKQIVLEPWMHHDVDHCCSLILDTWRNPSWTLLPKSELLTTRERRWTTCVNVDLPLPPRDYTKPIQRAIVTLDVEQIGPQEVRHHPLDRIPVPNNDPEEAEAPLFVRKPWGICTNTNTDQIFVADREHHKILVFGADGEFQSHLGQGFGDLPGQLNRPIALDYDAVGDRLFVVDKDNHRIQVFNPASGQFLFQFGGPGRRPAHLWYPWGVAVSKDGAHVAIADSRNNRIQLFTSTGAYLRQFRTNLQDGQTGKKSYLRGIAFDASGQWIYMTDFNLGCVFRLDLNCTRLEKVGEDLHRPSGIAVDAAGNLIVCLTRDHAVKVFRPDGRILKRINGIGSSPFDHPLDVAVLRAGYLAVLDLNGRVRVF